jgi:hypothetical protein
MRVCVPLALLIPSVSLAGAPRLDPSWEPSGIWYRAQDTEQNEPLPDADTSGEMARKTDFEVNFRGRMVSIPESLMDIWYTDEDDPAWPDSRTRTKIRGYGLGLEFVVKGESANGIFYLEYTKSRLTPGYWDDRDEPVDASTVTDGDFLAPTANLGLATFGADYAYEAHFVRTADTNGAFGLSMLVGGGLGVSYMLGSLERWGPGTDGTPAYQRFDAGAPADGDKNIPKVYPMIDINAGLRFNFGDRFVVRVEGGLHTLIYYGATAGIMF